MRRRSLEDSANLAGLKRVNPACPASLDTLKVSVPPAVKVAAATANLDIFLAEGRIARRRANLPHPDIIAAEIFEDLQAALAQFAEIANELKR